MKQRLLLLSVALILGALSALAQGVNITAAFTDEKFKAEVYRVIGKTAPEPILDTDVAGITSLSVPWQGISSMSGIEHFVNLDYLDCTNNQLSVLDVSNLTNLTSLVCYGNQLTTLDVANLTNLTFLSCHVNQLTTLDVANLTNLTYLGCTSNQLSVLDVSNLINLTQLDCSNNNLTTLDISGLDQLTYLDCRQNYLTAAPVGYDPSITTEYYFDPQKTQSIDITADFTDPNFLAEVYTAIGKTAPEPIYNTDVAGITYLNVSNKSISSMSGIEHFTSLRVFYCDNNQLTSLDVANLTNLELLSCDGNQLTSLDVANLTNLELLSCDGNQLTSLDVANLTNLTALECGGNQLTTLDVSNLTGLKDLSCPGNQLTVLDVANLTNLTSLYCVDNQLTVLDVANLTNLTHLYCGANQLTTLDISNLTGLKDLYCSDNQLTALDVANLTNLTHLYCGANQLTALDVANLTNLIDFYCAYNQISTLNITNLLDLQRLWCSENNLTTLNISGLNQLNYLDCRLNYLTADPTGYNSAITTDYYFDPQKTQSIDITADFTDPNFLAEVYTAIGKTAPEPIYNTDVAGITYLDVSNKDISSMSGIEHFTGLVSLNCSDNQLSTLDVSSLTGLKSLFCGTNQLTALDVANLTYLYCDNNQLTTLDVFNLTGLEHLSCSANQLTALDVANLTNLTALYCGGNQLTTLDVSNLTGLTVLYCSYNQLTALDVANLTNLTYLYCEANQLTALDVANLTNLTALYCGNNQLTTLNISGLNQLAILDCRQNYLTAAPVGYDPSITTVYYFDPQKTVAVTGISLNKTSVSLLIGESEQLTATVSPEDATNKNLTWSSSDETVATVSATGLVTAKAEGTATITVTTEDGGFTATCAVTVTRPLSNDATLSNLTVSAGTLTPGFNPNITDYSVSVENSVSDIEITATANHAAATVSGAGTKSLNTGANSFDITVTAEDGTTKTYTVTVNRAQAIPVPVTGVSLDQTDLTLKIASTAQLTATVTPDNADNQAVTWSSSDNSIATVSNGLVTAMSEGTATITVTTEDGGYTASCLVTVEKNQTVIVEEDEPAGANGTGKFDLSLTIPANALFTGSFILTLPGGFQLDVQATKLSGELSGSLTLSLTQNADGSWLFTISGNTLRHSTENVFQKIVDIVYTIDESLENGKYEVVVSDLLFTFEDGMRISEPEIVANVTVDHSYTGIQSPNLAAPIVQIRNNYLYVNTAVEEYIQIYSVTGQLLYSRNKPAGEIRIALPSAKGQMLVIKGSSGWVKKVM